MKKQRINLFLVFLLAVSVLFSSVPVSKADAAPAWSWEFYNDGRDIYMISLYQNTPKFEYKVGAGGSICEINYLKGKSRIPLIAPSYQGEETDRVVQWAFWGVSENAVFAEGGAPDNRFNINLAGDAEGTFTPVTSVQVTGNMIDIYSVPDKQFFPVLNGAMPNKIPALTRYELLADGAIKVRRILKVPNIQINGTSIGRYTAFADYWTPLRKGENGFSGLAEKLDENGLPEVYYKAEDIPYYKNTLVEHTRGYATAFSIGNPAGSPMMSIVYGKNQAEKFSTSADISYRVNYMNFDTGFCILPGVYVYNADYESILDTEFVMIPCERTGADYKILVEHYADQNMNTKLYGPNHVYTGELRTIVSSLRSNLSKEGTRTNRLSLVLASNDDGYPESDLYLSDVRTVNQSIADGDDIYFYAVLRNISLTDTTLNRPVKLEFFTDGFLTDTVYHSGVIPAGGYAVIRTKNPVKTFFGSHTCRVLVNGGKTISESNYKNNVLKARFKVEDRA